MAYFLGDSLSKSHKHSAGTPKSNFSRSVLSSMSTSANSKSAASPVKFSERTEQLRSINRIRKAPVGAQIKRVIDLLLDKRQALTPEEITKSCHVDVDENKPVFDSLRKNPQVSYDGERFCYKSKYQLGNKGDLLKFIKNFPEGIAVIDLEDAYTAVMGELQVLELPRDMVDIETDLQKNGVKPATNTRKRRAGEIHAIAPKPKTMKKQHRISKRTKLTNSHLPELFQHLSVPRS